MAELGLSRTIDREPVDPDEQFRRGRTETYTRFLNRGLGQPREQEQNISRIRGLFNQMGQGGVSPPLQAATPASSPPASGQYSSTELVRMIYEAGFRGQDVPLMAANVMRESGGNPGALNPRGEYSRGLLQINTAPGANTQYAGRNLNDPRINLQTAYEMFQNSGYTPWFGYSQNIPPRIQALQQYLPGMAQEAARLGLWTGSPEITFDIGGGKGLRTLKTGL